MNRDPVSFGSMFAGESYPERTRRERRRAMLAGLATTALTVLCAFLLAGAAFLVATAP